MLLEPDQKLLHYRLVSPVGEGGMGVVWRAVDESLDRDVAIKILPAEFAGDAVRLARFEREAKVLASIRHSHICQVYGLHEVETSSGSLRFLAMELLAGEDLSRRLQGGGLGIDTTIEIGRQICAALETAHGQGVIHRDLKPANIMISPEGQVTVLDFGLARIGEADGSLADASRSPTLTTPATAAGALLGTAAYMSPEQARGRVADKRADLWALGCVLFECLTGQSIFAGETISDTLAAVLRGEPDWEALPAGTPPPLRGLLRRCLQKDLDQRQRDAGDAGLDLAAALLDGESGAAGAASAPAGNSGWRWGWLALALVALVALGAMLRPGGFGSAGEDVPRVVRSTLSLPEGWQSNAVRISPDGRVVGVVASPEGLPGDGRGQRAFVRVLDRDDEFVQLPGELENRWLRFSPDSREVAVLQRTVAGISGLGLVRVPTDGTSPPSLITEWQDDWHTDLLWVSPEEMYVVAIDPARLYRLQLNGGGLSEGVPIKLDRFSEFFQMHGVFPDGSILGTVESWVGGYHQDAARLDPQTGEVTELIDRAFEPVYLSSGNIAFSRRDQVLAVNYDLKNHKVTSVPRVIESGVRAGIDLTAAIFSISDRGDLVYLEGGMVGEERQLVWVEPDGSTRPWSDLRGPLVAGHLDDSQDGRVISFVQLATSGLYEVWASEVDDPSPRKVLAHPEMDCADITVSPKGRRVAALCIGDKRKYGLYIAEFPAVGAKGTLVYSSPADARLRPSSFGPDGRQLLFTERRKGVYSLMMLELDDDGSASAPRAIEGLEGDIAYAMISDDGALIAFSEWDGAAWSIQVAPWDGERPGPARPVMRSEMWAFDWSGVQKGDAWELVATPMGDGSTRFWIDPRGRITGTEPIPGTMMQNLRLVGFTFLPDGRTLAIESDPKEMKGGDVRLVTDWARSLQLSP